MDTNLLDTKFARIGARLKVADHPARRRRTLGVVTLDVQADRKGEFFEIVRQPGAEAEIAVLDVQPAARHLLLLVREGKDKSKFLCGHDERHWFVAGIPESAPVGTVRQAKEALKPAEVRTAQARRGLRAKARSRRKNAAFVRQGEWFFLPVPGFVVDEKLVLPNEPLRRGNGGKPHWAELCYRTGSETVYVCSKHPNGVTEAQYKGILAGSPKAKGWGWRTDAAQSRRLRQGPSPSRRPCDNHIARLAPGRHEHRGSVEGNEKRGLPGLTHARTAAKTARSGVEPLRASSIRGRHSIRRKRWIATW